MEKIDLNSFKIPGGFFLLGVLFLSIGASGKEIAINLSKPYNAESWTTSDSLINAFTYVPSIIGISFLSLFISTFSITYYHWQKKQ